MCQVGAKFCPDAISSVKSEIKALLVVLLLTTLGLDAKRRHGWRSKRLKRSILRKCKCAVHIRITPLDRNAKQIMKSFKFTFGSFWMGSGNVRVYVFNYKHNENIKRDVEWLFRVRWFLSNFVNTYMSYTISMYDIGCQAQNIVVTPQISTIFICRRNTKKSFIHIFK